MDPREETNKADVHFIVRNRFRRGIVTGLSLERRESAYGGYISAETSRDLTETCGDTGDNCADRVNL